MKIRNNTSWETEDLRKAITASLRDHWKNWKLGEKHLVVEVFADKSGCSRARINGYWMKLQIWWRDLDTLHGKRKLAWVMRHEIEHLNGRHHSDMKGGYYHKWPTQDTAEGYARESWIDEYTFRIKQPKVKQPKAEKPQIDLKVLRYQHALAMRKASATKLKRATTVYKKWNSKVVYYENSLQ